MLLFVLWMAVGAIAGSLIGVYHCSNLGQALPRFSNPTYVSFCGGVGALAGFLMFVILARFFLRPASFFRLRHFPARTFGHAF